MDGVTHKYYAFGYDLLVLKLKKKVKQSRVLPVCAPTVNSGSYNLAACGLGSVDGVKDISSQSLKEVFYTLEDDQSVNWKANAEALPTSDPVKDCFSETKAIHFLTFLFKLISKIPKSFFLINNGEKNNKETNCFDPHLCFVLISNVDKKPQLIFFRNFD